MTPQLFNLLIGALVFGLIAWGASELFPKAAKMIQIVLAVVFALLFLLPLLVSAAPH